MPLTVCLTSEGGKQGEMLPVELRTRSAVLSISRKAFAERGAQGTAMALHRRVEKHLGDDPFLFHGSLSEMYDFVLLRYEALEKFTSSQFGEEVTPKSAELKSAFRTVLSDMQ
mmetsp:Transcript_2173/g.6622  ORF Transcript_2173/g.6622 Transcript_2173/m.6622 type:complete len:113 (+) Transcript_2173:210-548(+)